MKDIYCDLLAGDVKKASFFNFLIHYLSHPEFKAVVHYRLYSKWYRGGALKKMFSKILWLRTIKHTGCYISPKAKVGKGVRLHHATGIVIGDGVVIGNDVSIYQNVTLGQKGEDTYPTIQSNVTIYAGACILGAVTVGDNSIVGANAVVIKDVPKNSVAVGVPAKNIEKK